MPNLATDLAWARHIEVLRAIASAFDGIPSPCEEREALEVAIAAVNFLRQHGLEIAETFKESAHDSD